MKVLILLALIGFSHAAQALSVDAKIDDAKFVGTIEREAVRRSIQAKAKEFKQCGFVFGQLELKLIVDGNGQLSSLKANLSPNSDTKTEQCFENVARSLYMPGAETDHPASILIWFEIGKEEPASVAKAEKPKKDAAPANLETQREKDIENQREVFEKTSDFKLQSACNAYRAIEKVNAESNTKDLQLRKLAYDNNARARVFQLYASQMIGLKNKAEAFSEEYQKQSGKALDRKIDCGL